MAQEMSEDTQVLIQVKVVLNRHKNKEIICLQ